MTDPRSLLELESQRFIQQDGAFERLRRRRDRKRRNQRIAAGVVGLAVFVAAVWIVTSVSSLDRSETSVVPGGDVTGPAVTGPTATGPTETGPAQTGPAPTGPTVDADTGWIGVGVPEYDLPPEGAVPSAPHEGKVVAESHRWMPNRFVFVYADGRVISLSDGYRQFIERRLTPEGVDLVRSGDIQPQDLQSGYDAPANVWEDPEPEPFVPSRYSVCYWRERGEDDYVEADPSTVLPFFPAPARAILEGVPVMSGLSVWREATSTAPCSVVTTDQAHAVFEILGTTAFEYTPPDVRIEDSEGFQIEWQIRMMLPHGGRYICSDCF
jgi:hypothetical protein